VKKIPGLAGRVRIGAPDASLTPVSGVVAVAELVGRLGVTGALDDAVGEIKQRDRGLSAGEFLVAVAQAQMCGAEFWTGLDRRRADTAGEALSAVPTPASTTAVGLAGRFGPAQLTGIEEGVGEIVCRVIGRLPAARQAVLRAGGATIDLDGTDVEVYGSKKEGIAYSYKGARAGRPHVATWAEAGVVTAADLLAGDEDPRPGAGPLITRSVATLKAAGVTVRPKVRGDVGYFAKVNPVLGTPRRRENRVRSPSVVGRTAHALSVTRTALPVGAGVTDPAQAARMRGGLPVDADVVSGS
jgi:hypothetical protein